MKNYVKRKRSVHVHRFMILLLLLSLFTSGFTGIVAAEELEEVVHDDQSGAVQNRIDPIEYEDSILSKKATYTGNPGEYFIDLYVEGKSSGTTETTDFVLVYDNSNSMDENDRDTISQEATSDFVSALLSPENNENGNIRMALVTFGTDVFDGRENRAYQGTQTDNLSQKQLTTNTEEIIDKLPGDVPSERGQGNNGGTFTQAALVEAEQILAGSDADNKHIITITDGVPTLSYNSNGEVVGNGTSFHYSDDGVDRTHGADTIAEAEGIRSNGITMSSIGIEITGSGQASLEEAEEVMEGIASSPDQYYGVDNVSNLSQVLSQISSSFTKSIVDGTVTDPMGDLFNIKKKDNGFQRATSQALTDGDYYLSASENSLLDGGNATLNEDTITLEHLNLGADEWINLRYKVQLDTENENFIPETYYPTNGTTTLQTTTDSEANRNFPIPQAYGTSADISGMKTWEDYNQIDSRPEEIEVELWKTVNEEDVLLEEKVVTAEDNWKFTFENYPKYDNNGNTINYFVKESSLDHYVPSYSDGSYDITNTLIDQPGIELNKSSDLEYFTKAGQVITYTFEVKNTGNVPLSNIKVTDDMLGNEVVLGSTSLLPNEVTTATATYEITEQDFGQGEITNVAVVEGETPKGDTITDEGTDSLLRTALVTVKYVDEAGNELAASEELTGNIGDRYETSPEEIEGYELTEVPENADGEFTEETQTVTYVYKPVEKEPIPGAPVTVKYVDEAGNELAASEELTGNIGDRYETSPEEIEGYELTEVPENADGEFTEEAQTVTYVYKPVEEEPTPAAPVTVKYVDEDGNPLADAEELTGNIGEAYKTTSKQIEGYELKEVPENAAGEFAEEAQTVTYVYKPVEEEPTPAAPVTVKYVDEDGNPLADAEELNGNIGESYKTTPKEIDGYKRVKVVGKETGEFGEDRQTVTYIYEKINVSNPDKGKDVGSKPSVSDGQKLPDTATDSYNVIVLGLILLISGMILGFVYYRRQKLS